jgi:hypothetical protein
MALSCQPTMLNATTSDVIVRYLRKQPTVDYRGKSNLKYITK